MLSSKLVGIGNKARQGKTLFAAKIQALAPERIKVYAFADELKRYCAEHHDELVAKYPEVSLQQKEDPIYGFTAMLQHVGTNVMRAQDPDVWVKALAKRLEEEKPEIAILSDLRFPNEAQFIRDNDGLLIRLRRMVMSTGVQHLDPNRDPKHLSETALDDWTDWDALVDVEDGHVDKLLEAADIVGNAILNSLSI